MTLRAVLDGMIVTASGAAAALLLTTYFAIPSDGLQVRIILAGLITLAEATFLIRRTPKRITVPDAIISVIFVLAATLGLSRWIEDTLSRSMAASDFGQDYVAAYALRHGLEIFGSSLQELGITTLQWGNYHPPFNALLFLPFSFVHYPWAFIVWNFFSLLLYVALVLMLLESCGLLTFRWLRLSSVLLLWLPFTSSIFLGQLSIALSFGIIAGLFLLRAGRELIAGFCFGLATLIKLYPGLIFLYLLSQRRWRCCGAFAITVLSGFLLMILSLGSETLLYYVRIIVPDQMHLFASYPLNISLGSGIRTVFEPTLFSLPPIPAPQIGQITVGLITGGLILVVTVFSYFHNDSKYTDNLFSLFCITMLLTSPITWYHNCVLLLLPLALLVRSWMLDQTSASLSTVLLTLILCGVPNQDLLDGLLAFNSSDQLPWYVLLGARTGLFGLIWLYWVFWRRLARDAGYASVPSLFESLRLRLLSTRTFQ